MELLKSLFIWMLLFGGIWLLLDRKKEVWTGITMQIENCRERRVYIFLFLFVILSQGWMVFLRTLPISADEAYSISGASFFAGFDWSSYMHMKKFYNFGYTMLLAPVYKLFHNPVTIYRVMLFCNIILHAFTVVIVYYIMRAKLKNSKCFSIAAAFVIACNAIVLFFRGFMYNEMPLALIIWLIILLLLELLDAAGRKRIILSAVLGGVLAYAYIIHSRCIIVYASLALLVFLFLIIYRKWLVQPVSLSAVFLTCIYFEKMLMDYVQENLYLKGLDEVMPNSVEHVVSGSWRYRSLTSLDGICDLICRFFSLAGAMTIETGGILTIVTVAVLYYLVKNFKKYRKGEENRQIFVLSVFSVISLWGMVAAIALTGASNGKFRFLAYTRYFMPFIGPFILTGLHIMKKYTSFNYKWLAVWSGILTVLVGVVYVFYVYPILNLKSMNEITSFYFFMAFARYPAQMKFSKNVFGIALGLLFLFTSGLLFLYKRKQMTAICAAVMIFSCVLMWTVEDRQCSPASERRYKVTDAAYQLLEEEEALESSKIYCAGTDYYKRSLLIMCYDDEIVYDEKDMQAGLDTVMVSNKPEYILEYEPKYIYQMDNNEWVGIWDEKWKADMDKWYQPYVESLTE